jgi:hypothetical protein
MTRLGAHPTALGRGHARVRLRSLSARFHGQCVHVSDNAVGGLIALWRGDGITRDELVKRWPTTFDNLGKVYKVHRPMGDPYLMVNPEGQVVCKVAFGRTLPCGAAYLEKS